MATTARPGVHHEVENKLDADATFVLPDLSGLPGVVGVTGSDSAEVHELEALYLDSEDLRLARHGTTFRRRTGGSDAGWHLKLPAAKRGRIELHRDLGSDAKSPPADLLGLVRVQLRGLPVAPVARLTTRRTVRRLLGENGSTLAEIADDQVTAEAMGSALVTSSWREIEVELVDGDEDLLAAASSALIEAGALPSASTSKLQRALAHRLTTSAAPASGEKPSLKKASGKKTQNKKASGKSTEPVAVTAGEVVVAYLAEQVQALIAEDPRVRISADDAVHQMRVATRRLRTALASFRPLFADQTVISLRDELKWLASLLGTARDAEVMRTTLTADLAQQPTELVLGPVLRRIELELGEAYREAHEKIVIALDGNRYLALIAALEAFVGEPPFSARGNAEASTELRARVRKACRRVQKAATLLHAPPNSSVPSLSTPLISTTEQDQHLHDVRIAAKRARYAAEAVRPVIGKPAKQLASVMAEIQETLGDHQDAVVERQWLWDLGRRAFLAGENGFTFGRLHGLADARAQHDEDRFAEVWESALTVIGSWPD